jgi:hypothetical protein
MAPPHAWILNPEIEIENKNSRIQSTLKTRNQLKLNLSYPLTYKLIPSLRVLGHEWPLPELMLRHSRLPQVEVVSVSFPVRDAQSNSYLHSITQHIKNNIIKN